MNYIILIRVSLSLLVIVLLLRGKQHLKRTGWVLRNVSDCETIAGHMYRMTLMTFLLDAKDGLNRVKCMELGKSDKYPK